MRDGVPMLASHPLRYTSVAASSTRDVSVLCVVICHYLLWSVQKLPNLEIQVSMRLVSTTNPLNSAKTMSLKSFGTAHEHHN